MSHIGVKAYQNWKEVPEHFENVVLDEFIIMPNHMHGLIGIKSHLGFAEPLGRDLKFNVSTNLNKNQRMSEISPNAGSLSSIIRSYKRSGTRWCRKNGYNDFKWQAKFYEHIVRNERSLDNIREYIYYNPLKWDIDDYYI